MFGKLNAERYDVIYEDMIAETEDSVATLAELADGGRVLEFEIAIHDRVAQTVAVQRIVISEEGTRMVPHFMRYAWPSELDLMARLAGLGRLDRWAWWDRSQFTTDSKSHISVYRRRGK